MRAIRYAPIGLRQRKRISPICRSQNSSAPAKHLGRCKGAIESGCFQWTTDKAEGALPNADDVPAEMVRGAQNDCANRGIKAGAVAAARSNADAS